jgi:hypothetical protein
MLSLKAIDFLGFGNNNANTVTQNTKRNSIDANGSQLVSK